MDSESRGAWGDRMPSVGQVAERSRTVSAEDILRFTEISGDRNPLHYDAEAAVAADDGTVVLEGDAVCYTMTLG